MLFSICLLFDTQQYIRLGVCCKLLATSPTALTLCHHVSSASCLQ